MKNSLIKSKGIPFSSFFGQEGNQYSAAIDPLMMVNFGKQAPDFVLNDCHERIIKHRLNVILSSAVNVLNDDHVAKEAKALAQKICRLDPPTELRPIKAY